MVERFVGEKGRSFERFSGKFPSNRPSDSVKRRPLEGGADSARAKAGAELTSSTEHPETPVDHVDHTLHEILLNSKHVRDCSTILAVGHAVKERVEE